MKSLSEIPGKNRVIVSGVTPELEGGRFSVKAVSQEMIQIEADIFCDGHDQVATRLLYKHESDKIWGEVQMFSLNNDRWGGNFIVEKTGFYSYTIEAWVDHLASWKYEITVKIRDAQHVGSELLAGATLLDKIVKYAPKADKKPIQAAIKTFRNEKKYDEAVLLAISEQLTEWIEKYPNRENVTHSKELSIWADRPKAGFSTWYSMFPRSAAQEPGIHGTFQDVIKLLPRIQRMGFDVLHFTPIYPIGKQFRRGKNNNIFCQPSEPGEPYAIGSELGGHDAVHPELGTLDDFKALVVACKLHDMEIAMDLAIQCSPDHPWVKDHPEWFKTPAIKYQDIYLLNFEMEDWQSLWQELRRIIFVWAEWGIRIIRVDSPHTNSFAFWEWVFAETKQKYPDMIFLSGAFARPKIMQRLAKGGFSQSCTYYTWRNTKQELVEYITELTQSEMKHYFRPHFWPNTHDTNPFILQTGHEPNFLIRFFMAATLSSNYGIYGPTFEYMVHEAFPEKETYWNSEKYEIKHWDWEKTNKRTYVITLVNRVRKENAALQQTNNITFCDIDDDQMLAYLKTHANGNRILCVVNLDGYNRRASNVKIPLQKIGKAGWEDFIVRDLITGSKYVWKGEYNYVELDPYLLPFHLFLIEDL